MRANNRLLLITRIGAEQVPAILPHLIMAVQGTHIPVIWSCDPMHGNSVITKKGIKTRHVEAIIAELMQTQAIHQQFGQRLSGVHLEMTSEAVAECIGGQCQWQENDLHTAYTSLVDPRLNPQQAIEVLRKV